MNSLLKIATPDGVNPIFNNKSWSVEDQKEWKQWEEKFSNYAAAHLGVSGVPLSYVIHKADLPEPNVIYPDFVTMIITYMLLTGEYYEANKLTVFNMIVTFTTG